MGGIFSRSRSVTRTAAHPALPEPALLAYLEELMLSAAANTNTHCAALLRQDPFVYLNTYLDQHPDTTTLLIPYVYQQHYSLVCVFKDSSLVLHAGTNLIQEPWKIRIPTTYHYLRLPQVVHTEPTHSSTVLLTVATWCFYAPMPLDDQQRIRHFQHYIQQVKNALHMHCLSLDEMMLETLDVPIAPIPHHANLIAAQTLFWVVFDDQRRQECLESNSLSRHSLYHLFNFSHPESTEILKKFFASTKHESLEALLKQHLSEYETKALLHRLVYHTTDDHAWLMDLVRKVTDGQPTSMLPWQDLQRFYGQPWFSIASRLSDASPALIAHTDRQTLLRNMLDAAALITSPGEAMIRLFGGPKSLQFCLNAAFYTLKSQHTSSVIHPRNLKLSLFALNTFNEDTFTLDNPWLKDLVECTLEQPNFELQKLFFWLLTNTYPILPELTFTPIAEHLIAICQRRRHAAHNPLHTYLLSGLLLNKPTVVLPLLLRQDSEGFFCLEDSVIVNSLLEWIKQTQVSLLACLQQYYPILEPALASLLRIFEIETINPKVHDAGLDYLLSSDTLLPESLSRHYCQHLLLMVEPTKELTLVNVVRYFGYCFLLFEGENFFTALVDRHYIPDEHRGWGAIGMVVLYIAHRLKTASEGMDSHLWHANHAPLELLLIDFLSFTSASSTHAMLSVLVPAKETLLSDYRSLVISQPGVHSHLRPTVFKTAARRQSASRVTFNPDQPQRITPSA